MGSSEFFYGLQQRMDGSRHIIMSSKHNQTVEDACCCGGPVCSQSNSTLTAVCGGGTQCISTAFDGSPGVYITKPFNWLERHTYQLRVWLTSAWSWSGYFADLLERNLVDINFGTIYVFEYPTGSTMNPTAVSLISQTITGSKQPYDNCAYSPQRVYWTTLLNQVIPPLSYQAIANITLLESPSPVQVFMNATLNMVEVLTCPWGGVPRGSFRNSACYFLGLLGQSCFQVCSLSQTLPTGPILTRTYMYHTCTLMRSYPYSHIYLHSC